MGVAGDSQSCMHASSPPAAAHAHGNTGNHINQQRKTPEADVRSMTGAGLRPAGHTRPWLTLETSEEGGVLYQLAGMLNCVGVGGSEAGRGSCAWKSGGTAVTLISCV